MNKIILDTRKRTGALDDIYMKFITTGALLAFLLIADIFAFPDDNKSIPKKTNAAIVNGGGKKTIPPAGLNAGKA